MSERHSPAVTYPLRAAPLLRNGLWAVLILEAFLSARHGPVLLPDPDAPLG